MMDPGMEPRRRERRREKENSPEAVRRLGVLGTMVWDKVFRPGEQTPTESWGGLSYALEAFCAALPEGWDIVPILRVGPDRVESAREYLGGMERLGTLSGVLESPFEAVTVERHYLGDWRRKERLLGRELPWGREELSSLLSGLDALYLNFITGFEMGLKTALALKTVTAVPLYADLHSLFLDKDEEGLRASRTLPRWRDWLGAFDIVQMNEEEFSTLDTTPEGSLEAVENLVGPELKLLAVTLGAEGAKYIGASGFILDSERWPGARKAHRDSGIFVKGTIPQETPSFSGDPSGCGDVWGATFFSRLLAGDRLEAAMGEANRCAARKMAHQGAPGLRHRLSA